MKKLCLVTMGLLVIVIGGISCTSLETTPPSGIITPSETTQPSTTEDTSQETTTPSETTPPLATEDTSQETPPSEEEPAPAYSVAEVMVLLEPTVVRIETAEGSGSGIIISRTGYVLTNNHVVEDVALVKITLVSGEKYDGIVIARDEQRDLAIVGIIADRGDFAEGVLGSSGDITVGEEVVAIGYSLGLEGQVTVSKGIVSAIRNIDGHDYIQTDAAINPGNSSGPLVNLKGETIGINKAKYVGIDIEGIGLAIPIDEAKLFIEDTVGK